MARRRPQEPEDDGRTIVDMNVDGMPWYVPDRDGDAPTQGQGEPMTRREARRYTLAAIRAGLLVVLVFAVVFGLFIAFCDFVWFR